MKPVTLPFIKSFKDRHGRRRHYFRRRGKRTIVLPGEPGSEEFLAAYQAAIASAEPELRHHSRPCAAGSVEALVRLYIGSTEYRHLADKTRRETMYRLEKIRTRFGALPLKGIKRKHLLKIRDDMSATPGEANTHLRLWKRLLSFAIDRQFDGIEANVAARVKLLKTGEIRDWKDDELKRFEARWPTGSKQRLAYALLLYTGQRRQDVAKMMAADYDAKRVRVVQQKTGAKVDMPAHPSLIVELDARQTKSMMMLVNDIGTPYTSEALGQMLAAAIDRAGLPSSCLVHGLRKTSARKLAEAGCSEDEIMAVTGHRTSAMVRHYVRGANRSGMATAAVLKMVRHSPSKNGRTQPK